MSTNETYTLGLLAALLGALVLAAAAFSAGALSAPTTLLGKSAYLAVLWLILLTTVPAWWRTLKKGGTHALSSSALTIPIVVVCLWLLLGSHTAATQTEQRHDVGAVVANMKNTLFASSAPGSDPEKREERLREFAKSPNVATGSLRDSQSNVKAFVAKALALRDQWNEVAAQVGWQRILDPARLKADRNMVQSIAMVNTMESATRHYVDEMRSLYNGLPGAGTKMAQETKKLAFRSFQLQQQEIHQTGEVIAFLAKRSGNWSISGQTTLFQQQADADRFNQYLHALDATDAEMQDVAAKRVALGKRNFQVLESLQK